MRVTLALVFSLTAGITAVPGPALAQTPSTQSVTPAAQPAAADPLEPGKQALNNGDYAGAHQFFTAYVKDNPNSADALYLAGNASLGLKQYDDAAQSYLAAIKLQPSLWAAHKNLVIVYAAQEKWTEFDQERARLLEARTNGEPGLSNRDADVIDVLYVGPERYIVRSFAELNGRFKARYNIMHFGPNGKPDFWILCESDDVDQVFFAKAHPKEAAAGQRSFSLDSYTAPKPTADGKSYTQTHGTIKFYPDGEPSYETVRVDVLRVLEHKAAPMSSTTSSKRTAPNQ
jgi:hypothetical protein